MSAVERVVVVALIALITLITLWTASGAFAVVDMARRCAATR